MREKLIIDQKLALRKSIKHWERMRDNKGNEGEEPNGEYCACCEAFDRCRNCPIAEYVNDDNCFSTPYYDVSFIGYPAGTWSTFVWSEEFAVAAQKEIDFLKEVLESLEGREK